MNEWSTAILVCERRPDDDDDIRHTHSQELAAGHPLYHLISLSPYPTRIVVSHRLL